MEHAYDSSTVEMDDTGYDDLASQITERKSGTRDEDRDIRDRSEPKSVQKQERNTPSQSKRYTFSRGDERVELDDDYEIEITADKKPVRMSLKELKDRAAGDVAVKNRMHSLAEEKKRVQGTFREFAQIAKEDPLGAFVFISDKAKDADSEFEYQKYISKLAEQAETLGQMDEKERESWELKKKLSRAEEDLSRKERTQAALLRKQELLSDYPEIGDSEFGQIVETVLDNDELLEGVESESDVLDRAEELIQEILTQRDLMSVISEINPAHVNNNVLVFSLSDQIRQNPDLDEEDIREIVAELIGYEKSRSRKVSQRDRDVRTLSSKQRQAMPVERLREQHSDDFDLLKQQLMEKKDEIRKTPITLR